jgi:hypothetical protein
MKLPNGFGTVYKMQGNRRRPYVVKKTIQGKQKAIGYFETFEDAMACLVAYNRDPALLSPSRSRDITDRARDACRLVFHALELFDIIRLLLIPLL